MSEIRAIYSQAPGFPATDQHPAAVRYTVGGRIVDAIGGQPTQAEVDAFFAPAAANNGAGVLQSRRDALREQIDNQIGSLSEDQQAVLRNILKLIDKEV